MGPTSWAGTIFVGTDLGDHGVLAAFELHAQQDVPPHTRWQFRTDGRIFGTPGVYRGSNWTEIGVWTGEFSSSTVDNHTLAAKMYKIDPKTGRSLCNFTTEADGVEIWSTPEFSPDGGTVYFGTAGLPDDGKPPPEPFRSIYALSTADCSLQWRLPTGMWVRSSAYVTARGAVVIGSYDQGLYCLDPPSPPGSTPTVRWRVPTAIFKGYESGHPPGFVLATPAVNEATRRVFFGSTDKTFYGVNLDTGKVQWRFASWGFIQSSAALVGSAHVVFGSNDHNIYALEQDTGVVAWAHNTSGWAQSSPVASDTLGVFVGDQSGNLWRLQAP